MNAVGEEHKRFGPFVGTFKAEGKMWMGPGDPFVTTGVMTNAWDLGGLFLCQRYKGDATDGPFPNFEGRGYWGYNSLDKRYESFWIDSAGSFMQNETGQVDAAGKVWEMCGQMTNPQGGGVLKKRSVITLKDNDHHSMEMYFTMPDGQESKVMEIQYART